MALIHSLKDPELLAEATKAKLEINPLNGEELAKSVAETFKIDAALVR